MTRIEIIQYIKDCSDEPEDLDELVHAAKAVEAANINNKGIEAQIDYLLEVWGEDGLTAIIKS